MVRRTNKIPSKVLELALESSYDGLHILDKNGNTLYINEACVRIEGVDIEEMFSKDIRSLVEAGVYSQSVTLMVLETKESHTIRQTTKNGNEVLVTGTPIFDDDGEVEMVIVNSRDVTDLNTLRRNLSASKYQLDDLKLEHKRFYEVIANSTQMQRILSTALYISRVDSTVLLTGESGVGKGVLARFIHDNGPRAEKPFIKVDCSSIPENLLESELFGYEKGAFTGASQSGKIGLLEMAEGGTVFLDEIGEMPMSMQPKIMRAIQDLEIQPVGSKTIKKLNVRFIAATNIDLREAIEKKEFREDLYYRLNVIPIEVPPLRERKEDIPALINQMINRVNAMYYFRKKLSSEAMSQLIQYPWPGNVRQLENTVERILVSTESDLVQVKDLPSEIVRWKPDGENSIDIYNTSYKDLLAAYDKRILQTAIEQEGSIPKAAKVLGVDATTIRRKLAKFDRS